MTKKFLTFGILILVLMGTFVPNKVKAENVCWVNFGDIHAQQGATQDSCKGTGIWQDYNSPPTAADFDKPKTTTTTDANGNTTTTTGQSVNQTAAQTINQAAAAAAAPTNPDAGSNCTASALASSLFNPTGSVVVQVIKCGIEQEIKQLGYMAMTITGFVLTMVGKTFDKVMDFTIVHMATNLGMTGGAAATGIGVGITNSWETLRDIANMCFIFVLLYAAFKTMFDSNFGNFQTTVKNIIIIALLINFSLFFSKVAIDASNIVAIGFYNAITTGNTYQTGATASDSATGISGGYMRLLGLQHWYSPDLLKNQTMGITQILTTAIMASTFMLVFAVILLITGVMFLARFILLIFIMIISPVAFIAYIIPGTKKYFDQWLGALIDQSIFAPVFFALTWVVFKIASTPNFLAAMGGVANTNTDYSTLIAQSTPGGITIILNYVIIIGFAIAALVISKQVASKTAGFTAVTGGIGTAAIGGTALVGRNTLGRASSAMLNSTGLRNAASSGKWYSGAAKVGLFAANKGAKGSFDVRGIETAKKIPGLGGELGILGKAGGVGGFSAAVEAKAKEKAKYAKEVYGQSSQEKEEIAKAKKKEEDLGVINKNRQDKADETQTAATAAEKERKEYMDEKLKLDPSTQNYEKLKREKQEKERILEEAKKGTDQNAIEVAKKEVDSMNTRIINERIAEGGKKRNRGKR